MKNTVDTIYSLVKYKQVCYNLIEHILSCLTQIADLVG